jgi:hypothetical protein
LQTAIEACSVAGLRLPSPGELAEVFDNSEAPQPIQWTDDFFFDGSALNDATLYESRTRTIFFSGVGIDIPAPYRCVGTPTNY